MSAKDRINTIQQIITKDRKVNVSELSRLFEVTEETIRRDLEKLEKQGFLTRTYGGAVLNNQLPSEGVSFFNRARHSVEEKKQMAIKALPLLSGKNTIAADSSTTVMELLNLIRDRSDLTLLTNSTQVFLEFMQSDINIVSTGGNYNRKDLSLQGRIAKDTIKKHHVDVFLMSCKGLDLESGALDSNEGEAEIKKVMLSQASKVVLLIDHTKFDKKGFIQLTGLDSIDTVVTDCKPSDEWLEKFREHNIDVIF